MKRQRGGRREGGRERGSTWSLQPSSTRAFPLTSSPQAGGRRSLFPRPRGRGHWGGRKLKKDRLGKIKTEREGRTSSDKHALENHPVLMSDKNLSGCVTMSPPERESSRRSFFVLWWELNVSAWCRGFSLGLMTLLVGLCCAPGRKPWGCELFWVTSL